MMTPNEKKAELKKAGAVFVRGNGWYLGEDAWQGPDSEKARFMGPNVEVAYDTLVEWNDYETHLEGMCDDEEV